MSDSNKVGWLWATVSDCERDWVGECETKVRARLSEAASETGVEVLMCWCVDNYVDVLVSCVVPDANSNSKHQLCWCVDVLMFGVEVFVCWRVEDVFTIVLSVDSLICLCVNVLIIMLKCWCVACCCVDVLMCWWLCYVLICCCWCVDVLIIVLMTVLMCWFVDDCVDVLTCCVDLLLTVLMRWRLVMCWCVDALICW
jgi:hypothetical protein